MECQTTTFIFYQNETKLLFKRLGINYRILILKKLKLQSQEVMLLFTLSFLTAEFAKIGRRERWV